MARKVGFEGLYYITHIDNVISILQRGILSHQRMTQGDIDFTPIYDSEIISNRKQRKVDENRGLWDFANLYFQPRNAMLYRLVRDLTKKKVAILLISPEILNRTDIYIANGNAASYNSRIFSSEEGRRIASNIRNEIDKEWWMDSDGSKRKIMAECLVPESVSPDLIRGIYVANESTKSELEQLILHSSSNLRYLPITVEPKMFFQPDWRKSLTPRLSLVKGDMFFSKHQTLTISVNCVGVMGKGLASTARVRFPDVYVKYQIFCKSRVLKMGVPYIYKRESSVFNELADDIFSLDNPEQQTWFLLFPTKDHWKNKANIVGIEQGLTWLRNNYQKQGVESLAMPALGCGLGQLEWKDLGPLMCKYLTDMDIVASIYLPTEKNIPDEYLSEEFLLSQSNF